MKMLVCFSKEEDIQYHVFTGCNSIIDFVHDSLFQAFMEKGYTWSSVMCSDQLFNAVLFTSSQVERGVE